jgi:hypothetical protein
MIEAAQTANLKGKAASKEAAGWIGSGERPEQWLKPAF